MAAQETLYIKLDRDVEVRKEDVKLSDLGRLFCVNESLLARAGSLRVYRFDGGTDTDRCVISVMKIIEMLTQIWPGLRVESLGETEVLVERIRKEEKGIWVWLKTAFVCLISFFGPAFTIMAFHNDIGISGVFTKLYEMAAGEPSDGCTILEAAYSAGLAVGIILFFNHIGGRRITRDPTPIEVEMRIYEEDVNKALVETANREGKTIDVS